LIFETAGDVNNCQYDLSGALPQLQNHGVADEDAELVVNSWKA